MDTVMILELINGYSVYIPCGGYRDITMTTSVGRYPGSAPLTVAPTRGWGDPSDMGVAQGRHFPPAQESSETTGAPPKGRNHAGSNTTPALTSCANLAESW